MIDFGFGVPIWGREDGIGFLTTRVGTPKYLPPEITFENWTLPYQGQDADLFALAITLFILMYAYQDQNGAT